MQLAIGSRDAKRILTSFGVGSKGKNETIVKIFLLLTFTNYVIVWHTYELVVLYRQIICVFIVRRQGFQSCGLFLFLYLFTIRGGDF
jgi:hypothetical protein